MSGQHLAVDSDHLKHIRQEGDILDYLVAMKSDGLIRGDLITGVASGKPQRMTNIRLTYSGTRALRKER